VALAKPTVHPTHPFRHEENHEALLQYLKQRLTVGKQSRDNEIDRLIRVDKSMAGWMRRSKEDQERIRQSEVDGSPQAVAMNLPLSFVHVDDMMTYFAETFAPSRGMFYHTGQPAEVGEANQIITKMNNDAIYAGFYREVLRGIYQVLKYNSGGYRVEWGKDEGPKLEADQSGNTVVTTEVKWQGNRLKALDKYNLLVDPTVQVGDLHRDGEFAAYAEMRSHYWLQHRASNGVFFNCDDALSRNESISQCAYYRSPPQEAMFTSPDGSDTGSNWVNILAETPGYSHQNGFELVHIYIRLNPTEFGLIPGNKTEQAPRSRYEIWKFTVLNDTYIISAEWMNNAHGHIPFYLGVVNDDSMGAAQKSVAEILQPLQDFASFLLNLHVYSTRSSVWGLTVYDPTVVDFSKMPKGEINGYLPVNPAGYGKSIDQAIWKHNSTLETKQTISDLEAMMGIINQFFPTQALPSQIASIDRAVESQVAAVQHGANRRQQKTARLLDDSIFSKVRYAMYYNILQYMPDEETITDFYSGKPIELNLSALRNTNLPFIIGQGLKAIDRQAVAGMMQNIIFALIQAPQAAQGIDLLAMIDYWTSMIDVDIDMKQFRIAPQQVEGQPPQVDAAGNPIQPATDPAQIAGGPIYD
jgi:hypothetical protein